MLKKGNAHMDIIITIIGLFCAFGTVILLSIKDISDNVKLPIIALFMLIMGYCLIKKTKESKSGKDTGK
jgi:hypothetical protein